MWRLLIFISLFLTANEIIAQADFMPGYIIDLNGDTIYGEIKHKGDLFLAKSCIFKDSNDNIKEFSPASISSYRIIDSRFFITRKAFGSPIFMEVLVKGKVNLYYLRTENGDHYFLEKDSLGFANLPYHEELKHKEGNTYIRKKSVQHIGILRHYMIDAPDLFPQIERITKPDYTDLLKVTMKYHEMVCDNECVLYERKMPSPSYFIEPFSRLNWFVIGDNDNPFFEIGMNIYTWMPRSNEKLYFKTGLSYINLINYGYTGKTIDEWIFKIPIEFQYVFAKKKVSPKINAGLNIWFFDTRYKNVGQLLTTLNLGTGLNIKLNDRLSLSGVTKFEYSPRRYLIGENKFVFSLEIGINIKV